MVKEERDIAKIHRVVDGVTPLGKENREKIEVQTKLPGPKSPKLSHKMITSGKKYWEDGLGR